MQEFLWKLKWFFCGIFEKIFFKLIVLFVKFDKGCEISFVDVNWSNDFFQIKKDIVLLIIVFFVKVKMVVFDFLIEIYELLYNWFMFGILLVVGFKLFCLLKGKLFVVWVVFVLILQIIISENMFKVIEMDCKKIVQKINYMIECGFIEWKCFVQVVKEL